MESSSEGMKTGFSVSVFVLSGRELLIFDESDCRPMWVLCK